MRSTMRNGLALLTMKLSWQRPRFCSLGRIFRPERSTAVQARTTRRPWRPLPRDAERFHMGLALLCKLSPGQKSERSGDVVYVAQVYVVQAADQAQRAKAARLEVDRTARSLRVFDADKKLFGFYPFTAGSTEKP